MTSDAGVPGAPRFDVVLRGYDRRQVDEHVDRLQRVLGRMRADLDVARSQPMPTVAPAPQAGARPRPTPRPRPGASDASPDTIGDFTDRMQSILQAAEEEAAEIRRNAQRAARAETEGVRTQLADLTRQRDAVLAELTRMRGQLEGLLAAPTAAMPARDTARPVQAGVGGDPARPGGPDAPHPGGSADGRPADGRPAGGPPARPSPGPGAPTPGSRSAGRQPGRGPSPAGPPAANAPAPKGQPPASPSGGPSTARPGATAQPSAAAARPGTAQPPSPAPSAPAASSGVPTSGPSASAGGQDRAAVERASQERRPASSNGTPDQTGSAPTGGQAQGTPAKAATPRADDRKPDADVSDRDVPARDAARESGKAAHRLPTGAYPMVGGEQPASLRPRSAPQTEPGELFRSAADSSRPDGARPDTEPRTTAVPQQSPASAKDGDAEPGDRTAVVPTVPPRGGKPGDVESTVAVGPVRPGDPTVMAPAPGEARPDADGEAAAKPADAQPAGSKPAPGRGNGKNGSARPTTPSRSG